MAPSAPASNTTNAIVSTPPNSYCLKLPNQRSQLATLAATSEHISDLISQLPAQAKDDHNGLKKVCKPVNLSRGGCSAGLRLMVLAVLAVMVLVQGRRRGEDGHDIDVR